MIALLVTAALMNQPALAPAAPEPPAAGASAATAPAPLQMREIFWGDRHGHLRHRPIAFAGERPLEGTDFYRAVGRPDLAAEYEHRQDVAQGVFGAGLVAAMAGIVGAVVIGRDQASCATTTTMSACLSNGDRVLGAVSLVGVLGGGLMMVAATRASPEPASDEQRRTLVKAYNQTVQGSPRPASLQPGAAVSSHAALVGVTGRF